MNRKVIITTLALNLIILISSLSFYYVMTAPAIDGAMLLSMKPNKLPQGLISEYKNYSEKKKEKTFKTLFGVYNKDVDYINSQGIITNSIISVLNINTYLLFSILIINTISLSYILHKNRHNKSLKQTD